MAEQSVMINRAPVLTLWGAVVAERMGYDWEAALTLGKAMAGLNAQAKGRSLGIFGPPKTAERDGTPKKSGMGEEFWVEVCGRPVPAKNTDDGPRAVVKDKPIDPASVSKYLEGKFKDDLEAVAAAMRALANSFEPEELADVAYGLYERFRPEVPKGEKGWGRQGELRLDLIRSLGADA